MMKHISDKVTSLLLAAGAWAGTAAFSAAQAVNDLPGGPAVNQLNLHPPVTKIAQDIYGLNILHAGAVHSHFCAGVWGDVLFNLQATASHLATSRPVFMSRLRSR